jgi:hypothetical protein
LATWVTASTAVAGSTVFNASYWNAEVRDHVNWLRDLLTTGTDNADSPLRIRRAAATRPAFQAFVGAEANARWQVLANGTTQYGPGGATAPRLQWSYNDGSGVVPELVLANVGAGTGLPNLTVLVPAAPAGYGSVIRVEQSGVAYDPVALGLSSSGQGFVILANATGYAQLTTHPSVASRLLLVGDGTNVPQLGIEADGGGEQNSLFVWRALDIGDTTPRIAIGTDSSSRGRIAFGAGSGGLDAVLYREAASVLASLDTRLNLYRTAGANPVMAARITGDSTDRLAIHAQGYIMFSEQAAPGTPGANEAYLYCRDNGAGKTQLVAKFSDGSIVSVALQP